ncbi:hypothetical protein SETIT_2G081400v2 [Setaria italica]|uniref:Uncharacterized protein n=2 Tax=Setaria TaxID=4554 RepID=A0A368PW98_SETIT|nr:hypothetical protein SETIT_2G081400v2 [Setaria italica]TKW31136.1 hypothetical protein SEVIR_2G084900v2 [Setaria viridis]
MLVVQPKDKQRPGYIDLGVVSTDPANPIAELAAPLPQGDDAVTIFINRTIPIATGSYHICFPAANRWIALPLPPIATDHNTANGFHYDIGAEPGIISFMAVLLDPAGVDVVMFSSKTGNWETKALVVQEDAARDHGRGQPSPGIHAGNCFYWLSASGHGGVLCLDPNNIQPHDVEGVHSVWLLLDDAGAWQRVHEAVVRDDVSVILSRVP